MSISDWSSDVCSSDLLGQGIFLIHPEQRLGDAQRRGHCHAGRALFHPTTQFLGSAGRDVDQNVGIEQETRLIHDGAAFLPDRVHGRSEEHTSELQSLMRISYAVFCLKKKKQINT